MKKSPNTPLIRLEDWLKNHRNEIIEIAAVHKSEIMIQHNQVIHLFVESDFKVNVLSMVNRQDNFLVLLPASWHEEITFDIFSDEKTSKEEKTKILDTLFAFVAEIITEIFPDRVCFLAHLDNWYCSKTLSICDPETVF